MVSFPYYSRIFRDSDGSGMGIVWVLPNCHHLPWRIHGTNDISTYYNWSYKNQLLMYTSLMDGMGLHTRMSQNSEPLETFTYKIPLLFEKHLPSSTWTNGKWKSTFSNSKSIRQCLTFPASYVSLRGCTMSSSPNETRGFLSAPSIFALEVQPPSSTTTFYRLVVTSFSSFLNKGFIIIQNLPSGQLT